MLAAWIELSTLKWMAGVFMGFIVAIPYAINVLFVIMCVDIVSAMASPRRSLRSSIKISGMTIALCLLIAILQSSARASIGFNIGFDAASMVAFFYCINGVISILKNCSDAGMPLPPVLLLAMKKLEGVTSEQQHEIDALMLKQDQEREALEKKQTRA